jgi:hypothetical protein
MLGRADQGFVDINVMALNADIGGSILAEAEACFVPRMTAASADERPAYSENPPCTGRSVPAAV